MFKLYHIEWEGNTHFTNYTIFYFCQEIMNENPCDTSWWKWWCIHLIIPVGPSLNNFVCISVLISVVSCKSWTFMWLLLAVLCFIFCLPTTALDQVERNQFWGIPHPLHTSTRHHPSPCPRPSLKGIFSTRYSVVIYKWYWEMLVYVCMMFSLD